MEIARSPAMGRAFICLAFALLACFIIQTAWVSDDAYITFRVLDNFVHGYGLRWNIDERVQAYTHPLWMLIQLPLYALFGNIFIVTIVLGILFTLAATAIGARATGQPALIVASLFILPLALSKPFTDFATSGLENSLSYLLYAWFCWLIFAYPGKYFWLWVSVAVSLALLNRLDTLFYFLPLCSYLAITRWRELRFGQILLGATPLIAWFIFSLWYYGFLFPNTKYAKLNTGIDHIRYATQGIIYFLEQFNSDMISGIVLLTPFFWVKHYCQAYFKHVSKPDGRLVALAVGIVLHICYVIAVGGDFMSGRFFTVDVFGAVFIIARANPFAGSNRQLMIAITGLLLLKLLSIILHDVSMQECKTTFMMQTIGHEHSRVCSRSGIADEQFAYHVANQLFRSPPDSGIRPEPEHIFREEALAQRKLNGDKSSVTIEENIGLHGYYAGPHAHIIDMFALTDPLLARLPVINPIHWRIGHFNRVIPNGYEAAVAGDASQMNPAIAAYYKHLHNVVSGDLWSAERLSDIWNINTGTYDHFLQEYLRDQ